MLEVHIHKGKTHKHEIVNVHNFCLHILLVSSEGVRRAKSVFWKNSQCYLLSHLQPHWKVFKITRLADTCLEVERTIYMSATHPFGHVQWGWLANIYELAKRDFGSKIWFATIA